ncbi:hypothetical protein HX747_00880 [Streptomyces sp. L06]|nr:hypothetical protein [Streptomyces sp. L06]
MWYVRDVEGHGWHIERLAP